MPQKTRKTNRQKKSGGAVGDDKCPRILASIPADTTFERVEYSPEIERIAKMTRNDELPKEEYEVFYYAIAPIPQTIRSSIKNNSTLHSDERLANLATPRRMSYAKFRQYQHDRATKIIDKVNTRLTELAQPPLDANHTYDLEWLKNSEKRNIANNSKKGTMITREHVYQHFLPASYTGNQKLLNLTKPLPAGEGIFRYFLKKGLGEQLLCYSLNDLKRQGAKAVVLVCMNHQLKDYYERYGFIEIDRIPYMSEMGVKNLYYGDEVTGSGPVMYKRL